jgi:hypothetical protein
VDSVHQHQHRKFEIFTTIIFCIQSTKDNGSEVDGHVCCSSTPNQQCGV